MSKLFSQREVNKIFGHIPSRTLRWWGLMGLYQCAEEVRDGRGISRFFSLDNIYQIGIVEELSSLNIPTANIADVMKYLSKIGSKKQLEKIEEIENSEVADSESAQDSTGINNLDMGQIMKHILIITKSLTTIQAGRSQRQSPDWNFRLLKSNDDTSFGPDETVLMLVDQRKIKEKVDELVKMAISEG